MFSSSKLNTLRKSHYALRELPATIFVATADGLATSTRPIDKASLDEVAFSILKAEEAYSAAGDRFFALRKLYNLAREAGGVGCACAVEAAAKAKVNR